MICNLLLGSVVLLVAGAGVSRTDHQAEARAILARAIRAHGGETALNKTKAGRYRVKGTLYEGDKKVALNWEWTFQGMDKMRSVAFDQDGKKASETEVVNGKKGWVKEAGQPTEELSNDQVASQLDTIYTNWATMLVPLKAEGFRLKPLKEATVHGRKAVGILIAHDKQRPLKFYFDKESGLLVKLERPFNNVEVGKVVTEETLYSDFREVQGTKQPFKMVTFWDGVKVGDLSATEIRLYEMPLDEKLFSKP